MAAPTTRESDKFIVRLPDGMRDRIKAAAEANNRSMNAEIVATLEDRYPAPTSGDDLDLEHREITVRGIDRVLRLVRENMIRQLDGGGGDADILNVFSQILDDD
ncbi:Arc family DNA-binding protein [Paracoccus angustae]|uniref:Arc family DNA-binding protein n=1 Tax=Paracoccus angustae TaxID=1671480 RepID=A0ABV7TZQ4_9RHOB